MLFQRLYAFFYFFKIHPLFKLLLVFTLFITTVNANKSFSQNISLDHTFPDIGTAVTAASDSVFAYAWGGSGQMHARVFRRNGPNDYTPIGATITFGQTTTISYNYNVHMPDEKTIAIGSPYSASQAGMTRVYQWNGTAWEQKGTDLVGGANKQSGVSVHMADSNHLAILNFEDARANMYKWNGTAWVQMGAALGIGSQGGMFDTKIVMPDSNTIAIANPIGNANAGFLQVKQWDGNFWIDKGARFEGTTDQRLGYGLDMPDANTLIFGYHSSGITRMYKWNGSAWAQKGNDITGIVPTSVAAGDSITVAIGSKMANGQLGEVRIYKLLGDTWTLSAGPQGGGTAYLRLGSSLAMGGSNLVMVGTNYDNALLYSSCAVTSHISHTNSGPYLWNGSTYFNTGTYTWKGTSSSGCDSSVVLNLTIKNPILKDVDACAGGTSSLKAEYLETGVDYYIFERKGTTALAGPIHGAAGEVIVSGFAAEQGKTYELRDNNTNVKAIELTSSQNISIPNVPQPGGYSRTISFWIKSNDLNQDAQLLSLGGGGFGRYTINYYGSQGVVNLVHGYRPGSVNTNMEIPKDNKWHHITYIEASDYSAGYVDGIRKVSFSYHWSSNYNTSVVLGNGFNGAIDDFQFWNEIRTDQQILDAANRVPLTSTTNLVARYAMDEGSGTTTTSGFGTATYNGTWTTENWMDTVEVATRPILTSTTDHSECVSYTWNGTTYTSSGTYTWTNVGGASNGCDSVATLNLTIKEPATSTTNHTACYSYTWNGNTYTTSGIYTWTGTGANGCDSVATLNLTINNPISRTYHGSCDPFTWNGTTYTTTGVYEYRTASQYAACDSIAYLHFTAKPAATAINLTATPASVCAGATPEFKVMPTKANVNYIMKDSATNATVWSFTGGDPSVATSTISVPSAKTYEMTENFTVSSNYAVNFTGGRYAAARNSSNLNLGTNAFTIEFEYKPNTSGAKYGILSRANATQGFEVHQEGDALYLEIKGHGRYGLATGTSSDWKYVAITYDGTSIQFYNKDGGQLLNTPRVNFSPDFSNAPVELLIGANRGVGGTGVDYFYEGAIDNIRLWNVVKTSAQIAASATNCSPSVTTGLLANWKMNGGNGDVLVDESTNANDATLSNAASSMWVAQSGISTCNNNCVLSSQKLKVPLAGDRTNHLNVTSCDSYIWNGKVYNRAGNYKDTLTISGGAGVCDSSIYLDLTITANTSFNPTIACTGVASTITTNCSSSGRIYSLYDTTSKAQQGATVTGTGSSLSFALPVLAAARTYDLRMQHGNTAMQLTAANQEAYTNSNTAYRVSNNFTVSLWFRSDDLTQTNRQVFNQTSFALAYNKTTPNSGISFDAINYTGTNPDASSLIPITDKDWHHIAYTYDGSTLRGYKDGVQVVAMSVSIGLSVLSNPDLRIGGRAATSAIGAYDEVRFWNVARSAGDINSNMNTCLSGSESGLIGYWKLDEGGIGHGDNTASISERTLMKDHSTTDVSAFFSLGASWLSSDKGCTETNWKRKARTTVDIAVPTTGPDTTATACHSFTWNGTTYTTSGQKTWVGKNAAGCDSTVKLNLTITPAPTSLTRDTICGGAYSWNGNTYTTSGTYTHNVPTGAGCDSIATLELVVRSLTFSQPTFNVCSGNPARLTTGCSQNGRTYAVFEQGTNTQLGSNVQATGDSLIFNTPVLTVNKSYDLKIQAEGQAADFNGTNQTAAFPQDAVYNFAANGGTLTYSFWINPRPVGINVQNILNISQNFYAAYRNGVVELYFPGGIGRIGGQALLVPVSSNTWTHVAITSDGSTLKSYKDGVLVETRSYGGFVDYFNGNVKLIGSPVVGISVKDITAWNIERTAAQILEEKNGTASFFTSPSTTSGLIGYWPLNGIVNTNQLEDLSSQSNNFVLSNGVSFVNTGVGYVPTNFTTVSTATVNVNNTSSSTTTHTACGSYTWNGTTYTTSGIKTWTGKNVAGCDSTAILNLTITTPILQAINDTLCSGTSTNLSFGCSVLGTKYYLRNETTNTQIAGPVTGNGNTLTFNTGDLTDNSTFRLTTENNAINLSGTQQIQAAHNTAHNVTNSWTVAMWFKSNDQNQLNKYIFNRNNNLTLLYNYAGVNSVELFGGSVDLRTGSKMTVNGQDWTHIAYTYDGTTIKGYINGVEQISRTVSLTVTANTAPIFIGSAGGANYTQGQFNDVQYWNVARTPVQLQESMNNCLLGSETGLIGYWKMDEASGTAVSDLSPLGAATTTTGTRVGTGVGCSSTSSSDTVHVKPTSVISGFGALANATYGDSPITISGVTSPSSANPIIFSSSNTAVATVSGNTITIVGVGTTNITATQAGDSPCGAATPVVQSLTVNPRAITLTAQSKTKVYGNSDPALTYAITSGSLVSGDSFTGSLTRVAGENVGKYRINQGDLSIEPKASNYTLTYVADSLEITKRAITITAAAKIKNYGAADPMLTYTITGALAGGDSFTGSLGRLAGDDVGKYRINQGTVAITPNAGNYMLSYVGDSLTITTKAITVTAVAKTKVYGASDPMLTYTVTSGSLESGDGFTGSLTRVLGNNVGTYAINQGSLSAGNNYALTYVSADLSITKRSITLTADAKSKVYGASDPKLTYQITAGSLAQASDTSGLTLTRVVGENVGAYKIDTSGFASLSSNYTITYASANLSITKRAITLTADAKSKVFGGSDPKLTYQITSGSLAQASDTSGLTLTRIAGENVGTYKIDTSGFASLASNYTITYYVDGSLTITKATLTVTANNKTITYGDDQNAGHTVSYSGFVNSETSTVLGGSLTFANIPQPTTASIQHGVIVPSGLTSTNYTINYINGNLTVNKKSLTAKANRKTIVIGGSLPTFDITYSGFVYSDNVSSINTVPTASSPTTNVNLAGKYLITVAGGLDDAYDFTRINDSLIVGNKTPITASNVTWLAPSNLVYDGTPKTYSATANNIVLTGLYELSYVGRNTTAYISSATAPTNVGDYTLRASVSASDPNYTGFVDLNFTITKKPITITAEAKTKVYGNVDPSFTYTSSPSLISGDSFIGALSRVVGTNAGKYQIQQGTLSAGDNYTISYVPDSLTITQASLTIKANDVEIERGDSIPNFSLLYVGFVNGDQASSLDVAATVSSPSLDVNTQGSYPIVVSGALDVNYTITYINGTIKVSASAVKVDVEIPEIFTPSNGTLQILKIEEYPNNKFRVYNRWGQLLFEQSGYSNSNGWDGTTQEGKQLLEGTYFYVLDKGDGSEAVKKFIHLKE